MATSTRSWSEAESGPAKLAVDRVDYITIHELCHVKIHEHTPAFYRLLSRQMPDWERRKARLERIALQGSVLGEAPLEYH